MQIMVLPGGREFQAALGESERALMDEAHKAVPGMDTAEMKVAQKRLEEKHARPPGNLDTVLRDAHSREVRMLSKFLSVWLLVTLVGGFVLRGGLTLRIFGMREGSHLPDDLADACDLVAQRRLRAVAARNALGHPGRL